MWGDIITLAAFSLRTALEAVAHNKLRAALTSLGILFGVASVIAMLAIGKGAEQEILQQMALLGTNNVVITPIVQQEEGQAAKTGDEPVPEPAAAFLPRAGTRLEHGEDCEADQKEGGVEVDAQRQDGRDQAHDDGAARA